MFSQRRVRFGFSLLAQVIAQIHACTPACAFNIRVWDVTACIAGGMQPRLGEQERTSCGALENYRYQSAL